MRGMRARTPFRRCLTTPLLAALAVAAAAPAAHAAATWHAVAPPIEDYPDPMAVRFDPLGTAFASWTDFSNGARLVTRPSASAFGAPIAFPTSAGVASEFAFAPNGDGVFVGHDGSGTVRAATRAAGAAGAFGAAQPLGSGVFPRVAVNASGQALATWGGWGLAGPLNVAVRSAGGSFAAETLVGSPSSVLVMGAALDADGSGVVVYQDASAAIQAVARVGANDWTAPTRISPAGVRSVGFAANASGDAFAVWNEGETVRAAVRPRDGAFGAAQMIDQVGGLDRLSTHSVAVAADGAPLVTLDRTTATRRICTSNVSQSYTAELWRRTGGTWSSVVRQEGQRGRVATSPTGGHVALAWEGFVDPCDDQRATRAIRVRLGTVAGLGPDTLMPDQPVGQVTQMSNTSQVVAIDSAGNAILAWSARRPETGGSSKLRVMAYDTGSAPPGFGGGGGGGGGTPPGGGGSGGGGDDGPAGPDFRDLLGLRVPVRRIPLDLNGSLPASVTVTARCLARRGRCAINVNPTLGGSYTPARASAAARRGRRARTVRFSIALPRVRATVRAGRSARLKITIRGRALAKARTALRARGTVKLTIVTTVNGRRAPRPIVIRLVAARGRRARRGRR